VLKLKSNQGFTLIELLIVVVILGIITAIAVNSYSENVRRSRRVAARDVLLQNANFLQRSMTVNNSYQTDTAGAAIVLPFLTSPMASSGTNVDYDITFVPTATTYTLRAVPKVGGRMATDACGTYIVDELGRRTLGSDATLTINDCWTK